MTWVDAECLAFGGVLPVRGLEFATGEALERRIDVWAGRLTSCALTQRAHGKTYFLEKQRSESLNSENSQMRYD